MKVRSALAAALMLAGALSASASADVQPHPGDLIKIDGSGGTCTLGFMFTGSDRAAYMSTAGHCVPGTNDAPPRTWKPGAGPAVTTSGRQIGRVVFAENTVSPETGDDYDFALIRLDKGVKGSPDIRVLGTPTGVNSEQGQTPVTLRTYGHSIFSAASPARDVMAPNTRHKDHVFAHGPLFQGDSGAPVVDTEGRAVGTVIGGGVGRVGVGIGSVTLPHDGAFNIIGRLGPVVQHASSALRIRLSLVHKK
jgi:opacity protein-like surface antigen